MYRNLNVPLKYTRLWHLCISFNNYVLFHQEEQQLLWAKVDLIEAKSVPGIVFL